MVRGALSGTAPQITVTAESVQQIYIMYFYNTGAIADGKVNGKMFVTYAIDTDKTNAVVHGQLTEENRNKLCDMLTVNSYISDESSLTYEQAYEKLTSLQDEIKSDMSSSALEKDKVSGVYIKYAIADGKALELKDLL